MTTDELVAIFVGIVTAITTVVGGTVRSSRAPRLRKGIADDLAIYQSLPSGSGARPAIREGIDRQSAELAALVLHPTKASAFIYAFVVFIVWGVVTIVYVIEGPAPVLFQAGFGRGLVHWAYLAAGLIALVLFVRVVRDVNRQRARLRASIRGDRPE